MLGGWVAIRYGVKAVFLCQMFLAFITLLWTVTLLDPHIGLNTHTAHTNPHNTTNNNSNNPANLTPNKPPKPSRWWCHGCDGQLEVIKRCYQNLFKVGIFCFLLYCLREARNLILTLKGIYCIYYRYLTTSQQPIIVITTLFCLCYLF